MKRAPRSESDKEWISRIVSLGCIVAGCGRAACVHHPRFGQGKSQRAPDRLVLPLCPRHHQHGGFGIALHAGQKTWEKTFGTELELLEMVYAMLGEKYPPQELVSLIERQKIGYRILFSVKT